MIHIVVFNIALLAIAGYAIWGGGAPERWAAALMLVANVATALLPYQPDTTFASLDWSGFAVDAVLLAAFTGLALRANRFWPIWLAALQLLAVAIHVVRVVDLHLLPLVYAWSIGQIAYPLMAMLLIGTIRHRRRVAAFGADRAWSHHDRRHSPDPLAR